ncbi:protein kinase [Streptomyces sp. NPDC091272]|uniref:protein kinase domain-containing protein n=1 Tax=Streptomyces sp. NPDC091272 TaxID=3365981 RepID=UPI0038054C48
MEKAAAREATVLSRFRHPGVVQLKSYLPSGRPAGPTILSDFHPETLRLDEYLVQYGRLLDLPGRLALVRQLAETVRSAHSNRLHHRTLSAHSVHVVPRNRGPRGELGEEQRWLSPHLQIADWQIASGHSASQGKPLTMAPSQLSSLHVAQQADPYLAPELRIPKADPVRLDVYGLGVLTYLLITGQAPGANQNDVLSRLEAGETLAPSALVDGLNPDIDDLVEASTAYEPNRRLSTADDFLEMLEYVEEAFAEKARAQRRRAVMARPLTTTDPGRPPLRLGSPARSRNRNARAVEPVPSRRTISQRPASISAPAQRFARQQRLAPGRPAPAGAVGPGSPAFVGAAARTAQTVPARAGDSALNPGPCPTRPTHEKADAMEHGVGLRGCRSLWMSGAGAMAWTFPSSLTTCRQAAASDRCRFLRLPSRLRRT